MVTAALQACLRPVNFPQQDQVPTVCALTLPHMRIAKNTIDTSATTLAATRTAVLQPSFLRRPRPRPRPTCCNDCDVDLPLVLVVHHSAKDDVACRVSHLCHDLAHAVDLLQGQVVATCDVVHDACAGAGGRGVL